MKSTSPKLIFALLIVMITFGFMSFSSSSKWINPFTWFEKKQPTQSISLEVTTPWFVAGSTPDQYDMGIDDKITLQNEKKSATIKCIVDRVEGFGTIMQNCRLDRFIGKRIKMTGFLKSEKVEGWAGLWLRIDEIGTNKSLSFDNMNERSIKGTTDWTKYEIVLDIPINSSQMAFGALLNGKGQIWFDNIGFEIVSNEIPVTKISKIQDVTDWFSLEPTNLSFEK